MSDDDWNKPPAPLAPGLRKGPAPPLAKIELDPVVRETTIYEGPLPIEVEELQMIIDRLRKDNLILMSQIEDAWAVIKTRDDTIAHMEIR